MGRGSLATFGLAALLAAPPVLAQRTTGNIVGTVRDASGALLPGVRVGLHGEMVAGPQTTVTNESGFYRFAALPPGSYELSFQLSGFATLRRQGVRVAVGATEEIGVELKVSPIAEEVTVVGDSPIVDTQTNQVGANYDQDWVRNAPIPRFSFFDLISAAPGVSRNSSGSAVSMVFGSGADENSYQIDGTELTSSFVGIAVPFPNTDAIEEVEVLSLGAPAEYGNVAGAVFNLITRQGTNAFHGDLNFYLQTDGLSGRNTGDSQDGGFPFHREKFRDLTAQAAGPILKDRLWFFASYQYQRDYKSPSGTDPRLYSRSEADRIFGKLNWQISPKHKLAFSLHNDYYSGAPSPPPNYSATNISVERGDNPTPNLMYTGVLSDKTVAEVRFSGFFGNDHTDPLREGQPRIQPVFYDLDTGQFTGGTFGWGDQKQFQERGTAKLTRFADDFLGGSHDFRFGVQFVRGGVDDAVWGYNDYIFTYGAGAPSAGAYGYQYQPYSYGGITDGVGLFGDDAFRPNGRVTVNVGVRYDHNRARVPDLKVLDQAGGPAGETIPPRRLYSTDTLAPRLGLNLKLTADGRTVLRGHYGRYYRGVVVGEFASSIGVSPHVTRTGAYDLATGAFVDSEVTAFSQNVGVDPAYRIPHTDQLVASLERELGRDLGLALHYVYKRGSDYSAWRDISGEYADAVYVDDQGAQASGEPIGVERLVSDPAGRFFEQGNPPQMRTSAHALSATVVKRMSRGWQLQASYTYLRSRGLLASASDGPRIPQWTSLLFSTFGQNPNDFVNAEGLLAGDRPHTFKAQLVSALPAGFLVSANYVYQTGRAWARLGRVPGLGFPADPIVQLETLDGERRLPSQSLLDLRLQKSFALGRTLRLAAFGDVFNLFNEDSPENLLSRIATSANFGVPAGFLPPRRLMLGGRLAF